MKTCLLLFCRAPFLALELIEIVSHAQLYFCCVLSDKIKLVKLIHYIYIIFNDLCYPSIQQLIIILPSFSSFSFSSVYVCWLSSGTIIGKRALKRAPFLVLGLSVWYGTIFLSLEQITLPRAAHASTCFWDDFLWKKVPAERGPGWQGLN